MILNICFPKVNEYETAPVDETACDISYQYWWIKELSSLVSAQINKKHGKKFLC